MMMQCEAVDWLTPTLDSCIAALHSLLSSIRVWSSAVLIAPLSRHSVSMQEMCHLPLLAAPWVGSHNLSSLAISSRSLTQCPTSKILLSLTLSVTCGKPLYRSTSHVTSSAIAFVCRYHAIQDRYLLCYDLEYLEARCS